MLTGRDAGGAAPRTPRSVRGAYANGEPCGGPRPPAPPGLYGASMLTGRQAAGPFHHTPRSVRGAYANGATSGGDGPRPPPPPPRRGGGGRRAGGGAPPPPPPPPPVPVRGAYANGEEPEMCKLLVAGGCVRPTTEGERYTASAAATGAGYQARVPAARPPPHPPPPATGPSIRVSLCCLRQKKKTTSPAGHLSRNPAPSQPQLRAETPSPFFLGRVCQRQTTRAATSPPLSAPP
jgi:hypothetical protein